MGIKGLLPFLKKVSCPVNLKEFSGYTAAIDVYCWIHKSSYGCAMDLALGNPTDQYIRYVLRYLEMMFRLNVKPILVFDGANLPSKSETERKRKENKDALRKKAAQFLLEGNREAAQECFERSVFVTPQMAQSVLRVARNSGVDCIVAPYEADAQLAHLNREGYADLVVTEDSDLLLFGCRQVIFKLDMCGSGILVSSYAGIGELCCGMRTDQYNENTLRYMGILSGCDYFSGIPGIGLSTAAKILRQSCATSLRDLLNKVGYYVNLNTAALSRLGDEAESNDCPNLTVKKYANHSRKQPLRQSLQPSLIEAAIRADRTFRLQVVFDPLTRRQQRLSEPSEVDLQEEMMDSSSDINSDADSNHKNIFSFAGRIMSDKKKALQIALGNICFENDFIVDQFDPDNQEAVKPSLLKKPRSEGSLLQHNFTRSSKFASGTRPVLGQLGNVFPSQSPAAASAKDMGTSMVGGVKQPNPERVLKSIWDPKYPVQKVWLHYRKSDSDDKPSIHCLSVEPTENTALTSNCPAPHKHPVAQATRYPSTRGQHMFVAAAGIATCLRQRFSKRTADELIPSACKLHRTEHPANRNDSSIRESSDDGEIDDGEKAILNTYAGSTPRPSRDGHAVVLDKGPSVAPVTSASNLRHLTSCLSSTSVYFCTQAGDGQLRNGEPGDDDDVASALANALNAGDDLPASSNSLASSPVFLGKNPFSYHQVNPDESPSLSSSAEDHLHFGNGNLSPQPQSGHHSPTFESPPPPPVYQRRRVSPPHLFPSRVSWPSPIRPVSPPTSPTTEAGKETRSSSFDEPAFSTSPSFLSSHMISRRNTDETPPNDEECVRPVLPSNPRLDCSTSIARFKDMMPKPSLRRGGRTLQTQIKAKRSVKTKRGSSSLGRQTTHGADIHQFFRK